MARKNREISRSGIYHVILRGVNKQRIFEWKEDYTAFLDILQKKSTTMPDNEHPDDAVPAFEIYAYCLMDNHVHLLLGERKLSVGDCVKRIAGAYAQHFNLRYHRVGHLFQDRFKSTPCEDEKYFFTLLDYIHNNPVKGGISDSPADYPYSSYREIVGQSTPYRLCSYTPDLDGIGEKDIRAWVKDMVPEKTENWLDRLIAPLLVMCKAKKEQDPYQFDQTIVNTLCEMTHVEGISEFQRLEKKPMREALAIVRDAGVSIRHLSRLTGISEGIIRNCKNPKNM